MSSQKNKVILAEIIAKAAQDPAFRSSLLADPGAVLKDAGVEFDAGTTFKVLENTADLRYIVLPYIKQDGELSDAEIDGVAAGGSVATVNVAAAVNVGAAVNVEAAAAVTTEAAAAETTAAAVAEAVAVIILT